MSSDKPVVLFDAVSTIICPKPDVITAYHQMAVEFGTELSREHVRQGFRELRQQLFDSELPPADVDFENVELISSDQIEFDLWRCLVERLFTDVADPLGLFHALWSHFAVASNWRVYDDVHPCWTQLKEMDVRIGIASNFDSRLFQLCRQLFPELNIDFVFCSARTGFRKPDSRFFQELESRISCAYPLIMVGDDVVNDHLAPSRLGWQSFLIDRNSRHPEYDSLKSLDVLPEMLAAIR